MYSPDTPTFPRLPIKFELPLFLAGFVLIAGAAISIPEQADAFWPFSTNADAAGSSLAPNSATPLLAAAINVDPNPDKGLGDTLQTSDNAVIAHTGLAGTIADVASSTPPDRISIYVVRPGDTLSEIAGMFNVSVNTIIWANNLSGVRDIHVGDTLIILPVSGTQRTVVKGDTLKSIAKKYNADAGEIAQFNGLDADAPLTVGSTLIIPGGEVAVPVASPKVISKSSSSKTVYEPYLGGGGAAYPGYYENPIPNARVTQSLHGWNAVDLGAARGTPIRAAADGTVIISRGNGAWNGGYGNYVVITHSNGSQTMYAHMTRTAVSSGQYVSSGQVIGYVGSTGLSTGAHLHFEVRGAANPLRNCSVGSTCAAQ